MSYYSQIIQPADYNVLMSKQHLYIAAADNYIVNTIFNKAHEKHLEVVELGCGPARVLQKTIHIKNITLSGIDIDDSFLEYAKTILKDASVNLINCDLTIYRHPKLVDVFYSQGFHHHVPKGESTQKYLASVYEQLAPGGIYIIGDEFIPPYKDESGRIIQLIIWYSHVIAHAIKHGFDYLAQEEAKTLLDDILEGKMIQGIKNQEQITHTLAAAPGIAQAAANDINQAYTLAHEYLEVIKGLFTFQPSNDITIDLSRRDYKISDDVFREEIQAAGFKVVDYQAFGPMDTIGGMAVYVLKKEKDN